MVSYFIAGANRGIGLATVHALAQNQDALVFATTRSLDSEASQELMTFASIHSNVKVIPLDITNLETITSAVKKVEAITDHLDVLIVNAAIMGNLVGITETELIDLTEVLGPNVVGAVHLFREFTLLLKKSHFDKALFVTISSAIGSSSTQFLHKSLPYAISKAALNHVTAAIDYQNNFITAFPIHPGLVVTRMSGDVIKESGITYEQAAESFGLVPIQPSESAVGIVRLVKHAIVDGNKYGGRFWSYDNIDIALAF